MKPQLRKYFAEMGRKGGKKSKRTISQEQQAAMQLARSVSRKSKTSRAKNSDV